jgi:hypothetical protein
MKKVLSLSILFAFSINLFAQKNSYTCAVQIIEFNKKIISFSAANNLDNNKIKAELEKLTTDSFATALMNKNFWEYRSLKQELILQYLTKIENTENSITEFPNLAKIFGYTNGIGTQSNPRANNSEDENKSNFQKAIPSEAIIIQGITNFVAKRFKQEIELAFFKKFRDFLVKNTTMGELYPKTVQIFKYDNAMGIDQLSNSLRTAFAFDLQHLSDNLVKAINEPSVGSWFAKSTSNKDLKALFLTGNKYISSLAGGKNPQESLNLVIQNTTGKSKPFLDVIKIYLEELSEGSGWAKPSEFNSEINNVFSALLYNKYSTIFKNEAINNNDKEKYRNLSYKFLTNLNDFSNAIYLYEKSKEDIKKFTIQDYMEYLNVYNYLFLNASELLVYKNDTTVNNLSGTRDMGTLVNNGIDLVNLNSELLRNIVEMKVTSMAGNYNLLVSNANFIITNIYNSKDSATDKSSNDKKIQFLNQVLPKMFFYGTFITEFCNSKDEKDISNLLDKFAMPAGGYSVKNVSNFTVMLDAYVGANLGYESFVQNDNIITDKTYQSTFVSLFSPIGLEFSARVKKGNIGLFIPIIDIAAPISFRLGNTSDSLKTLPELSFKNIISPGLFFKYGLENSPLTFLIGAKLAPLLRKKDGDVIFEANRGWRYGFSIAADLTLFKIWVCPKRKYNF